eukprot:CAMPEP_0184867748 /NCGR_PEP_ID=MMETSP0580-20130426/27592_1 /TAXON_ID=1118495 /ORGANISM="Dactyliosolen fragilissimus" /LENGTH=159 /DNA_ID=CAMNT_0027368185 /DNA_START=1 /DNA_END=480 /DNA_ORIENTATION=-
MSQVETILALARTYSSRTSAPPGWNPSLPVVHFATPNPLPHQLRGGALGAIELKMVRDERRLKRRKKEEELEAVKRVKAEAEKDSSRLTLGDNPRHRDDLDTARPADMDGRNIRNRNGIPSYKNDRSTMLSSVQSTPMTTMNLSDSSSEEDESDGDESD